MKIPISADGEIARYSAIPAPETYVSIPRTAVAEAEGFIGPTIGRSGYRTMAEFDAAVGARYQQLVDQGYADTMGLVGRGLVKNDPMVIGNEVDV